MRKKLHVYIYIYIYEKHQGLPFVGPQARLELLLERGPVQALL